MSSTYIRLFVAAALPEDLAAHLHNLAGRYESDQIRIVPKENLHLTLLFIGNTKAERLTELTEKLHEIALQQQAFTLQPEGVFPGPGRKNPRLVWAKFLRNKEYENLALKLQQELAPEVNLPKDFIPHITLARMRKNQPVSGDLQVFPAEEISQLKVTGIGMWKSELGQPHPTYSVLQEFPFAKE